MHESLKCMWVLETVRGEVMLMCEEKCRSLRHISIFFFFFFYTTIHCDYISECQTAFVWSVDLQECLCLSVSVFCSQPWRRWVRCLLLLNLSHTFFKNLFLFTVHSWVEKSETSSENACVLKFIWTVIDSRTKAIWTIPDDYNLQHDLRCSKEHLELQLKKKVWRTVQHTTLGSNDLTMGQCYVKPLYIFLHQCVLNIII